MTSFVVKGFEVARNIRGAMGRHFKAIVYTDSRGAKLSLNNGEVQFTIPLEPVLEALKEETKE